MPVTFKGCNIIDPTSTQNKEDLDIKQSIKKILHMQTAANIMLKDVNQRLTKIETALKNHSQKSFNVVENTLIAKFLPLTTIENIKEFDVLLKTTDEAVTQFKEFISKIGGNNSRDNIHRTLRKIFTNECAMNCSWKGLRNNFRIVDLYITKLIKREIISCYINLTESEFDNVAAEWLRFSKQRKQRDDNATRNEKNNRIN
nr:PREDICTED: uncharacterized protein LOC105677357 [Linepithema humile]